MVHSNSNSNNHPEATQPTAKPTSFSAFVVSADTIADVRAPLLRTTRLCNERRIFFTQFSVLRSEPSGELKAIQRARELEEKAQREKEAEEAERERLESKRIERERQTAERARRTKDEEEAARGRLAEAALAREKTIFEERRAALERELKIQERKREAHRAALKEEREDLIAVLERLKSLNIDPEKICIEAMRAANERERRNDHDEEEDDGVIALLKTNVLGKLSRRYLGGKKDDSNSEIVLKKRRTRGEKDVVDAEHLLEAEQDD